MVEQPVHAAARADHGRAGASAAGVAGDAAAWTAREGSRRAQAETPRRTPRDHAALALRAATHGVVTRGQLARKDGISGDRARVVPVGLVSEGVLRRVGAGRATRYVTAAAR